MTRDDHDTALTTPGSAHEPWIILGYLQGVLEATGGIRPIDWERAVEAGKKVK